MLLVAGWHPVNGVRSGDRLPGWRIGLLNGVLLTRLRLPTRSSRRWGR